MKYILALAVVLAAVAVVCDSSVIKADSRANLNVGSIVNGDVLLYRNFAYRAPSGNTVQSQDLVWRGTPTNRITAVVATEVGSTQKASAKIQAGGVGRNTVTIRFKSAKGKGFNYLVDIWGR